MRLISTLYDEFAAFRCPFYWKSATSASPALSSVRSLISVWRARGSGARGRKKSGQTGKGDRYAMLNVTPVGQGYVQAGWGEHATHGAGSRLRAAREPGAARPGPRRIGGERPIQIGTGSAHAEAIVSSCRPRR